MVSLPFLLSQQSKRQQMPSRSIARLLPQPLKCRGCYQLTDSFLSHPTEHFESYMSEVSHLLLISKYLF